MVHLVQCFPIFLRMLRTYSNLEYNYRNFDVKHNFFRNHSVVCSCFFYLDPAQNDAVVMSGCIHFIFCRWRDIKLTDQSVLSVTKKRKERKGFVSRKSNNIKVGINCLTNRLYVLNNVIPLNWLNDSMSRYKVKCKKLMLM